MKKEKLIEGVMFLVGLPFVILLGLPMGLLFSWLRTYVWNWFVAPYFHLPPMHVWLMLTFGILVNLLVSHQRQMKETAYEHSNLKHFATRFFGELALFGICWAIHHWRLA